MLSGGHNWTLGQLTYEAYWRRWPALALPWDRVTLRERRCWEAAARAAIAAWERAQGQEGGATKITR